MTHNVGKEIPEGIQQQVAEIRIPVAVVADIFAELGTVTVRKRLGIDLVDQFIPVLTQQFRHFAMNGCRLVPADEIPDEILADISSATLVSQYESERVDVHGDLLPVVQTSIRSGAQYGRKARFAAEQGAGRGKEIHRDEHFFRFRKNLPQHAAHERILKLRDAGSVEMDFPDLVYGETRGERCKNVPANLVSADVIPIVAQALEVNPSQAVPGHAGPGRLGRSAVCDQYHIR